jgi:hypothetical protein
VEHDGQTSVKKKKKKEEVQNIETNEEDNTSEESGPEFPTRGGGDEVNQEKGGEDRENKGKGEVTPPKDLPIGTKTSKKRKDSLEKPSTRKKKCTSNPKMKATLTMDDIDLIITTVEDDLEDILQ